ncbi:MAG: hypothetical protein ACI304_08145, partial [Lepagella sp.]
MDLVLSANFQFSAHETGHFFGLKGISDRLRWSSEVGNRHDFLCSSILSSLLLFFDGKLPRGKYSGVCHVDAEKEQQCLAAGVACRYPAYAVVLFLIAEAALHGGRAQSADNPSCGAYVGVLILWLRTFAYKAGRYAVFGASLPFSELTRFAGDTPL